jgi:uncharacterized phage protein (TIGR02218 family)
LLSREVLSLCRCWKITIDEYNAFYLTSLDRPITIEGYTYYPRSGFSSESIEKNSALSVDNTELDGIFDSEGGDGISWTKIKELDGARIEQYLVDWAVEEVIDDLGNRTLLAKIVDRQLSGIIGEVKHSDRIFSVEMRSLSEYLNQTRKLTVTARCPLQFGQAGFGQCNASVEQSFTATITSSFNARAQGYDQFRAQLPSSVTPQPTDTYNGYAIKIFDVDDNLISDNRIRKYTLSNQGNPIFRVVTPVPFPFDGGMTIEVIADCEKTLVACRRFDNLANFKGWHDLVPTKERLIKQLR